jgi:hypothetical protein
VHPRNTSFLIALAELLFDDRIERDVAAIAKGIEFTVADKEVADRVVGIDIGPASPDTRLVITGAETLGIDRGANLLDLELNRQHLFDQR